MTPLNPCTIKTASWQHLREGFTLYSDVVFSKPIWTAAEDCPRLWSFQRCSVCLSCGGQCTDSWASPSPPSPSLLHLGNLAVTSYIFTSEGRLLEGCHHVSSSLEFPKHWLCICDFLMHIKISQCLQHCFCMCPKLPQHCWQLPYIKAWLMPIIFLH